MKKTVLLTGATGFLGSHILESLLKNGMCVIVLKRSHSNTWRINHLLGKIISYDIDKASLEEPFKDYKIDIIIHCATNYGRQNEPVSTLINTNIVFPIRLLELAIAFNTDTFFNTDTLQYKYLTTYSLSKKHFVEWLKIFSDKIKIINFKLEHIYGPKDDEKKFVPWLINQLLFSKDDVKLTKGEQKRDFIYITDVVSAYITVLNQLDKLSNFTDLDVGTGNFITIKDFVLKVKDITEKLIAKQIDISFSFGALPYREGEIMEIKEDLTILTNLGWRPVVDLETGLTQTIKSYLEKL